QASASGDARLVQRDQAPEPGRREEADAAEIHGKPMAAGGRGTAQFVEDRRVLVLGDLLTQYLRQGHWPDSLDADVLAFGHAPRIACGVRRRITLERRSGANGTGCSCRTHRWRPW